MNDTRKDELRRQRKLRQRKLEQRKQRKTPTDQHGGQPSNLIIGYVSRQGQNMVCDGDACIVAGTREAMVTILEYHRYDPAKEIIEPAMCSHILQVIAMGGAYAFDEQAYNRFLPEALRVGLPLVKQDFSDPGPTGIHLVRVCYL